MPPPAPARISVHDTLPAGRTDDVLALIDAASSADGVSPVDEDVLLQLQHGSAGSVRHLLADDGGLAGYAFLARADRGGTAKLVVHPAQRRRGVGTALARHLTEQSPATLDIWAHGHLPGAQALAKQLGFTPVRELWKMRLDDPSAVAPSPTPPPGIAVRTYRPDDAEALLELNRRAFADHPEQGRLTMRDLRLRMDEDWFDPEGLFLAERAGRLVGFHWTKVHGPTGESPYGEVYVVGVDPQAQGGGLGRFLTAVGLRHLADRGLSPVRLYVEGDNAPAIAVYRRLGFEHTGTDVLYRH